MKVLILNLIMAIGLAIPAAAIICPADSTFELRPPGNAEAIGCIVDDNPPSGSGRFIISSTTFNGVTNTWPNAACANTEIWVHDGSGGITCESASGGASTGWGLVSEQDPVAQTSVSFTGLTGGTRYRVLWSLNQNTSTGYSFLRFNTNSSSAYSSMGDRVASNGTANLFGALDSSVGCLMQATAEVQDVGTKFQGTFEFRQTDQGAAITIGEFEALYDGGSQYHSTQGGCRWSNAALSSVQFHVSAGTFTGNVQIWIFTE